MTKKIKDLTLGEIANATDKLVLEFCKRFSDEKKDCYSICPMLTEHETCIFDDLYHKDFFDIEIEV